MKTMSCKELGGTDCEFSASGETADDVKKAMFAHAEQAHPEKLAEATPQQMQQMQTQMDRLLA